jgi:hypothetical protein
MTYHPYSAIRMAVDGLVAWCERRRELRELGCLDGAALSAIARDLRISPADLEMGLKATKGRRTANIFGLFDALGIAGEILFRSEPAVVRDMQRVCALCPAKTRCDRDLREGISYRTFRKYCPNSPTIDALGPCHLASEVDQ